METCAGEALGGIGSIHLPDGQGILLLRHVQFANHNRLNGTCGMGGRSRTRETVLLHGTIAPNALSTQIKNVLGAVPEGGSVQFIINVRIAGALQNIVDGHQFFGAGYNGVAHGASLVTPYDCLNPGIHVPGVPCIPNGIDAQGNCLIRKFAGGMCVVIRHHLLHGGVRDLMGVAPGLAKERIAHALALFTAEADGVGTCNVVIHLVQGTLSKRCRVVRYAGHAEPLQFDRVGFRCERCGGEHA